jgi:hypothetical protein
MKKYIQFLNEDGSGIKLAKEKSEDKKSISTTSSTGTGKDVKLNYEIKDEEVKDVKPEAKEEVKADVKPEAEEEVKVDVKPEAEEEVKVEDKSKEGTENKEGTEVKREEQSLDVIITKYFEESIDNISDLESKKEEVKEETKAGHSTVPGKPKVIVNNNK